MSSQPFRTEAGGLIDRNRPVRFRWGGRQMEGFAGDTLASALLANGVRLVGRSFKYHRPRGLMGTGVEEANGLVQLGQGARCTPNLRATEIALEEGLDARPVNCWPSARWDIAALADLFGRFLPAGFYYKTFMWPHWHLYEGPIRRAAGLGKAPTLVDPDRYETRSAHCDILVIGGGPAGLAAARSAAAGGARVILAEQEDRLGGSLLTRTATIDGLMGTDWAEETERDLQGRPEVRILTRTTATGYYDHNAISLVERAADELSPAGPAAFRQRLWEVRAGHVIMATGGIERPLVFPGNDRPGVMLAGAAQSYLRRFGVRAGRTGVVFTNNDRAYEAAIDLSVDGVDIPLLVDVRRHPDPTLVDRARQAGIEVVPGGQIVATEGRLALKSVQVRAPDGRDRRVACDLLAISGGFNPTVHLFSQSGGRLRYDPEIACFRPDVVVQNQANVGAADGVFGLAEALAQASLAGTQAALQAGFSGPVVQSPLTEAAPPFAIQAQWSVDAKGKAFVDFQNDVTTDDIALAARENFRSVEHLKRYTTLGMAPDQGKTSNVNAIGVMAALTGRTPPEVGTTRYRPPFTPTALGVFAGRTRGDRFRPRRRLPMHDWHVANGAVFEEFGAWSRPAHYLRPGEDRHGAIRREMTAVRTRAGLLDYSPLGKLEVKGPDAATFLDRIYANGMSSLKVGRLRYGLMLNELGVIIDDGVVARLADDRFWLTTTSGGADRAAAWLEEWLQCEWTDLKVLVTPVTTTYATLLLSGPRARAVLTDAGVDFDLSGGTFPHMRIVDGQVAGIPARVLRASYTGEVSFELNVAADQGAALWDRLMWVGRPLGLEAFGLDALLDLRAEKGFIHIGGDTDGTTVPDDIGWGHVVNRSIDFIGKLSLTQPENQRADRWQLVGLEPLGSGPTPLPGMHLRGAGVDQGTEGFVTAAHHSQALGRDVVLAMVRGGRARLGQIVSLIDGGRSFCVGPLTAYDAQGDRLNG